MSVRMFLIRRFGRQFESDKGDNRRPGIGKIVDSISRNGNAACQDSDNHLCTK